MGERAARKTPLEAGSDSHTPLGQAGVANTGSLLPWGVWGGYEPCKLGLNCAEEHFYQVLPNSPRPLGRNQPEKQLEQAY